MQIRRVGDCRTSRGGADIDRQRRNVAENRIYRSDQIFLDPHGRENGHRKMLGINKISVLRDGISFVPTWPFAYAGRYQMSCLNWQG